MPAPDARAGAAQYDGGHEDWSAAEALTFLPVRAAQASLTQTVRLREISRVPRWIMGDSWMNNNERSYFSCRQIGETSNLAGLESGTHNRTE